MVSPGNYCGERPAAVSRSSGASEERVTDLLAEQPVWLAVMRSPMKSTAPHIWKQAAAARKPGSTHPPASLSDPVTVTAERGAVAVTWCERRSNRSDRIRTRRLMKPRNNVRAAT